MENPVKAGSVEYRVRVDTLVNPDIRVSVGSVVGLGIPV